jgi:hypothetical protein
MPEQEQGVPQAAKTALWSAHVAYQGVRPQSESDWIDALCAAAYPTIRAQVRAEVKEALAALADRFHEREKEARLIAAEERHRNGTNTEESGREGAFASARQSVLDLLATLAESPSEDTTKECNCGVEKERSLRHSRFCPLYGVPAESKEPIDG